MGREFLFNADFDLSLRPGWKMPASQKHAQRITELGVHALFAAEAGDSFILEHGVPQAFARYLADRGMGLPEISLSPSFRGNARFTPFGWNEAAAQLNRRYAEPTEHPATALVRLVNGRDYAAELAAELGEEDHHLGAFASVQDLEEAVERQPACDGGWVVKANHGNAAMGNLKLRSRRLQEGERVWVGARLAEDQPVLLEPWRNRLADLCATFAVNRDGSMGCLNFHEVVNTAAGAFIGALFVRDSQVIAPWRDRLAEATEAVCGRLSRDGYFGPACVDAFVWSDGGKPRLRAVVDLNARRNVSLVTQQLWQRTLPEVVAYWRFYTRRKLSLPDDYGEITEAMGDDALKGHREVGTLLTSPLWLEGGASRVRPHKLGVLFLGCTRDEVLAMDRRFRRRFAARPGL